MAKKVYVVNATDEILSLFQRILSEHGYDVTTQPFPLRSLEAVRQIRPSLIVLDFIISDEDSGWTALELLKMSDDLRDIPVIICSAPGQRLAEMDGYLKEKGVGLLLKPFDSDELMEKVTAALEQGGKRVASVREDGRSDRFAN